MTERRPLVIVSGSVQEIATGDTVYGASCGTPTLVASSVRYTVAVDMQLVVGLPVTTDGEMLIDGAVIEAA